MDSETPLHLRPIIDHLVYSFKKAGYSYEKFPYANEEPLFEECSDSIQKTTRLRSILTDLLNISKSESESESNPELTQYLNKINIIEEEIIKNLNHIIAYKESQNLFSRSESLPRFMLFMSTFTVLTSIASILAILLFLPTVQPVAVLLIAVMISLAVLLQINIILLKGESPALSNLKTKIALLISALNELNASIESDENEKNPDGRNTPSEHTEYDASSESVDSIENEITSDGNIPFKCNIYRPSSPPLSPQNSIQGSPQGSRFFLATDSPAATSSPHSTPPSTPPATPPPSPKTSR